MFYMIDLDKELEVAPRFFGPKLREEIDRRLRQEVRDMRGGRAGCSGRGQLPGAERRCHCRCHSAAAAFALPHPSVAMALFNWHATCRWRAPATASTALCWR